MLRFPLSAVASSLAAFAAMGGAVSAAPAATAALEARHRDGVAPLLARACGSCHDADAREAGIVVTALDGSFDGADEVAVWKKIRRMVTSRAMPPEEADPLTADEVALISNWVEEGLRLERVRLRAETSRQVPRRLTSREFNGSLLRLVGAETSVRDFPRDENVPVDAVEKDGFSNDARGNPLTKSHLEGLKLSALEALEVFAPFVEAARPPLHYFYDGEVCHTSRATQDHIFDFVKNVPHPLTEAEFRHRREVMALSGTSFLGRPMNKAVFGPALYPFRPGPLENFENDLLLADAAAFPASQMHSRGRFTFRVRVRGRPAADGTLPLMRIRAGFFDCFANHFRTVDAVQVTADERVYEFAGNVRDYPFLEGAPREHTYRDGNVPRLTSFATNDWVSCASAFFIVLVENAGRHEEGLSLAAGHHRLSLGNIHIGSYAEILQRARDKTLPNYYMEDEKIVEAFTKTQQELAGKAPAIEIDWAELTLDDVPLDNAVFFAAPDRGPNDGYAARVIERFVRRAYRGFATDADVQSCVRLYATLRGQGVGFEAAVHEVLASALVAPQHLFLADFSTPADARARGLALAARLAFWLWGEPPDDRLLAAAADGRLHDDAGLRAEVARMFADPRVRRFADHFLTEAWHLDGFDRITVDGRRYAFYDPELEADMKEQFRRTAHDALGLNGPASVLSLIDSDQLWVNRRLAKLCRLEGYDGRGEFRKVRVPADGPLGGALTQPLLMKMNSDGTDSHPVRRGTWVLERILFDPPPPPPKVTPLQEQGLIKGKTLRERIAEHAQSNASCVACHRRIDPFGLALENFDAVGGWRETEPAADGAQPAAAAATLADGTTIDSPAGLKAYILTRRRDAFSRGFVESLVQYAVGRRLDPADDDSIEQAWRAFVAADYDFQSLVQAVAASESFRGTPHY